MKTVILVDMGKTELIQEILQCWNFLNDDKLDTEDREEDVKDDS